jgi:hypothetical protein
VSRDVALEMSGGPWWKAWAGVTSFVTAFDNSVLVGYWAFWEDGLELRVVVNEVPVFGQYSTDVWYIWVIRYTRRGLLSFVDHSIFSFDTACPFTCARYKYI